MENALLIIGVKKKKKERKKENLLIQPIDVCPEPCLF